MNSLIRNKVALHSTKKLKELHIKTNKKKEPRPRVNPERGSFNLYNIIRFYH